MASQLMRLGAFFLSAVGIVAVNRTLARSAEDASRALDYYARRGPIRLLCEREGQIFPIDFVIR
jgi:hypothetical protein